MKNFAFALTAAMTVLPCAVVALSSNILYSAFALFFMFLGTSGLYLFLGAEFLALTQVIVYVGGVSVLMLFAILLTKDIAAIRTTNTMSPRRAALAGTGVLGLGAIFWYAARSAVWAKPGPGGAAFAGNTLAELGRLLLSTHLLPLEAVSILLLAVLVGSLVIARKSVR